MNDEGILSFQVIANFLGRHRLLIGTVALFGAIAFGWLAFTTKPYFRAEISITDVRDRGMANVSSLASQLGGLASLAGVNIQPGGNAANQAAAAVLDSNHLAGEFIRRNGLIPLLLPESSRPRTLWLAVKKFKEGVLTIRRDRLKGLTTVIMQWDDATTAARWANAYVALANELLRNRAIDESSRNIAYLNQQMSRTDSVDLRKVMYSIIENETKTLMVANGRPDYSFEVIDPAVPPEIKAGPHRLLICLVGAVLGFAAGGMLAFVRDRFGNWRTNRVLVTQRV